MSQPNTTVVLPPCLLRKEQLAALTVLCNKLTTTTPSAAMGCFQVMPVTGFTHLTMTKIRLREALAAEPHWVWSQSHGKAHTELKGSLVEIRKFSPKRISSTDPAVRAMPVPRYKVWLLKIGLANPLHFIWVERGAADGPTQPPGQLPTAFRRSSCGSRPTSKSSFWVEHERNPPRFLGVTPDDNSTAPVCHYGPVYEVAARPQPTYPTNVEATFLKRANSEPNGGLTFTHQRTPQELYGQIASPSGRATSVPTLPDFSDWIQLR